MTEINILLDTDFEEDLNKDIAINDKLIFYQNLDQKIHIYLYNDYNTDKVDYNGILLDLIDNDNYLEQLNELEIDKIQIKKLLLKKILEHINPIIDFNNINQVNFLQKKKIILDKNSITLNYPIDSKYIINKKKEFKKYIIPANNNFLIKGLYNNRKIFINVPYKINNFKYFYINKFLLYKSYASTIFNKKLNYNNIGLFDINKINITDLQNLYNYLINRFNLYLNNSEINKLRISEKNTINTLLQNYNKNITKYINNDFINNYITKFNEFLTYKISDHYNNNIYFSFYNSDLLNLYENILIYSIDNKFVNNKIQSLINEKNNKIKILENQKIIDQNILINNQLEYICKQKFPNLFNKNSKDFLFINNKFNINILPKKYKDIILLEYKKYNQYIKDYLNNNCEHKDLIKRFNKAFNKKYLYNELTKLIDYKKSEKDSLYKCLLCSFNLICPHIVDYYNLLYNKNNESEFRIQQKILNNYMASAPINMIYYCKICGEELGKSQDLEQNIEFKDNIRMNVEEYTDETLELIKYNVYYIVRTYISFSKINLNITKKYITDYVIKLITFYINQVEKKIRKIKNYNEEHIQDLLNFNIIIFTYAALIFIMVKYNFIVFNTGILKAKKNIKGKYDFTNIIIKKSIGGKLSNKELMDLIKTRFKESFDLIYTTNNILLTKLNYIKNIDNIKQLLIKSYTLLKSNDEIEIQEFNKDNLNNLLLNYSFIYKYLYNIQCIYPINIKKNDKFSLPFFKLQNDIENYSNKSNIKFNEYNKILNLDISKNPDNLFHNYKIPLFQTKKNIDFNNIKNINKINNYNEYKYLSFLSFYFHIYFNLYELPIFEFIENIPVNSKQLRISNLNIDDIKLNINTEFNKYSSNYIIYIKLLQIIKEYELKLINDNILYNLYPYSNIKLNNSRYFNYKDINLNIYLCLTDGKPHKFNIYIYNINNKEVEYKRNNLDKLINENKKYEFIDYKCSKCLKYKNKIINQTKYNNLEFKTIINTKNDINAFYNLYKNKCPIADYHNFIDNVCTYCKITNEQIFNKDEKIFDKFKKQYNKYILEREQNYNLILNNINNNIETKKEKNNIDIIKSNINLDIIKKEKYNIDNFSKYIDYINSINIDDLYINLSNLYKIDIIYLQLLGITEGYNYEDLKKKNINDEFNNRFIKLSNYIRSIIIYINLLKNNKYLSKYYDLEFYNIIQNLNGKINTKDLNIINDFTYKFNILNLYNYIKITNSTDYNYIIKFGLKIIYNLLTELINNNKNKLNNKLDDFIKFIIFKILKFDELYTNYNYSQLKQMFTEDNPNFIINNIYDQDIENENEDDDELFGYNDLNINFEDEEPIEN